jgi:hypothetical protein
MKCDGCDSLSWGKYRRDFPLHPQAAASLAHAFESRLAGRSGAHHHYTVSNTSSLVGYFGNMRAFTAGLTRHGIIYFLNQEFSSQSPQVRELAKITIGALSVQVG